MRLMEQKKLLSIKKEMKKINFCIVGEPQTQIN